MAWATFCFQYLLYVKGALYSPRFEITPWIHIATIALHHINEDHVRGTASSCIWHRRFCWNPTSWWSGSAEKITLVEIINILWKEMQQLLNPIRHKIYLKFNPGSNRPCAGDSWPVSSMEVVPWFVAVRIPWKLRVRHGNRSRRDQVTALLNQ